MVRLIKDFKTASKALSVILTCATLFIININLAKAEAEWQTVEQATIEQTKLKYVRGSGYFTDNTITLESDLELSPDLRLVVTNNTRPISNADSEEDGRFYFDLSSINDTTRIWFERSRARFDYDIALEQLVETASDFDDDGILDEDDLCPEDARNTCIMISGMVFGSGAALANVDVSSGSASTTTDLAGTFEIGVGNAQLMDDGVSVFFGVDFIASGFASSFVKIPLEEGEDVYTVDVNMITVSDTITEDEDLDQGVDLLDNGELVGSIMIPDTALPQGVEEVSGTVTYLDPETDDILSTPGRDLLALPEGADPNEDDPVSLETFGMMEFDLKDQDGNDITELDQPAELCMKAPSNVIEGEKVPLWYYDEAQGIWVEEGEGEVIERNGELQICGEITHFSWWNYDRPISTHSCMYFEINSDDENDNLVDGLEWYSEGVSYSGSSPSRACTDNVDSSTMNTVTVKISDDADNPEQVRIYTILSGTKYYLASDDDVNYSLVTNSEISSVFETPSVNGSCLTGTENGTCMPLDHQSDGDGIITLSTAVNLPPVITDFVLSEEVVTPGAIADVFATIIDPDGTQVSVEWSTVCRYYDNEFSSASIFDLGENNDIFSARFNAPDSISSTFESCAITVVATDADGGVATAERFITVANSLKFEFFGVIYNTDGQPFANLQMDYENFSCEFFGEEFTQELPSTVTTDEFGNYAFSLDLEECFNNSEDFYLDLGRFVFNIEYDGEIYDVELRIEQYNLENFESCSLMSDNTRVCEANIDLPRIWIPLNTEILLTEDEVDTPELFNYLNYNFYNYNAVVNANLRSFEYVATFEDIGIEPETIKLPERIVPVTLDSYISGRVDNHGFMSSRLQFTDMDEHNVILSNRPTTLELTVSEPSDFELPAPLAELEVYYYNQVTRTQVTEVLGDDLRFEASAALTEARINLYEDADEFAGYIGFIDSFNNDPNGVHIMDLFGTDECEVNITLYDKNGDVFNDVELEVHTVNGRFGYLNPQTFDENGQAAITMNPGRLSVVARNINGLYYWQNSTRVSVPNCRPDEAGNAKVLDVDIVIHASRSEIAQ